MKHTRPVHDTTNKPISIFHTHMYMCKYANSYMIVVLTNAQPHKHYSKQSYMLLYMTHGIQASTAL